MASTEFLNSSADESSRQLHGWVRTVEAAGQRFGSGQGPGGGTRTVVELRGEIDIAMTRALNRHLDAATAADRPQVVIDLRGVTFIDSAGMGPLCRAWCRAQDRGGDVSLICADPRILRTLRLAGLIPTMSVSTPRRAVRLGRLAAPFRLPFGDPGRPRGHH